jgi:hypothetical protein
MKITATILIVAVLLILCASMIGMVGFHYPHVIQDEPLQHPQNVLRVEGTNIVLESGAMIALDQVDASGISNKLKQSAFQVDIEGAKGGPVGIWARQDGWICGTPWAQPIRIPLIRDTTYKNRRELIAVGSYLESGGQQDGAANGSQPIRSETNGTSSAAGSRR